MKNSLKKGLRDPILWVSNKPIDDQLTIMNMMFSRSREVYMTQHLLSIEEQSFIKDIGSKLTLLLRHYLEEDIIDLLIEMGLTRMISMILLESVKVNLAPRRKNLTKLPPKKLKEYTKEAVSYLLKSYRILNVSREVERLARRHKLVEIQTIIRFVNSMSTAIGTGRTTFEELRDKLQKEGFTEEQINALLTPMKEKFEEIRKLRIMEWERIIDQSLHEFRLEIVTDKAEYYLGETINATFYIVNDRPKPAIINRIYNYELSGNSEGDPEKSSCGVHIDYTEHTPIVIPAHSKYEVDNHSFHPKLKGRFTISVIIYRRGHSLSGSLTLLVR